MSALGIGRGTAMYVGAVLGPGVLVLPAAAVSAAGPASLVAWAALFVLSVPVACAYAALAVRYPDGAGVATFASRAFGLRTGTVVGWWFYAAVPAGTAGGALIGGGYVAAAIGAGTGGATAAAAVLLAVVFAGNLVGLRQSAAVQLVLVVVLVVVLGVAIIVAGPQIRVDHFTPFTPAGWPAVGHASAVLFLAFTGWEAATHLAADFARPGRQIPVVTAITLAVVGVLYLGLAAATIGVLGPAAASPVALTGLLERGIGPAAPAVTGAMALVVTAAALNTFVAAGGRLGAALARDGGAPRWLASPTQAAHGRTTAETSVPHRSIAVQATATAVVTAVAATIGSLDTVLRTFAVLLTAVTAAGLVAAAKLLPAGGLRRLAIVAAALTGLVLACNGTLLLIPIAVSALGWMAASRRPANRLAASYGTRRTAGTSARNVGRVEHPVTTPHLTVPATVPATAAAGAASDDRAGPVVGQPRPRPTGGPKPELTGPSLRLRNGRSAAPSHPNPSQTRTCSPMNDQRPATLADVPHAGQPCRHARVTRAIPHRVRRQPRLVAPTTTAQDPQPGPTRAVEAVARLDETLALNPAEEIS